MHSKAQISSEFLILLGVAFLVAIAFELNSLGQLNDFRLQQESEAVRDLALKLQKEFLIAAAVEDGYVRTFQLPDKLDRTNYFLTTINSTITVKSKNSLYIVSIPNAIGNASKGTNIIGKTGGLIYINSLPPAVYFTDSVICQNAQNFGLCSGLDILYGAGYQTACCSEHVLCC